jgi:hypothetical protein
MKDTETEPSQLDEMQLFRNVLNLALSPIYLGQEFCVYHRTKLAVILS